ncbi:PAS domain-containing protein [Marinobacter nauticus]|uniref:PAS domain-containing protein n=1 Tax=Marinobacter nauticus TaxID=2743 RepID=UPI00242FA61A|nr:PAS domain-containing protein [Marinobacter nauticus]
MFLTRKKKQDMADCQALASQCQAVYSAIRHAVATIEFTTDGLIVDVNDRFLEVVGYRREEVVGKHHSLFCDREVANSAEYRKFWDALRAGQAQTDTFRRRPRIAVNSGWRQPIFRCTGMMAGFSG